MIRDILDYMRKLSDNKIELYRDGEISVFNAILNAPVNKEYINYFEESIGYQLPKDYKEFLLVANGIQFFEAADFEIFDLEYVKELMKFNEYSDGVYVIGSILEDYILINSKEIESGKYLYFGSSILPQECISFNHNFEMFLKNFIGANFQNYWSWFDHHYTKFVDFSANQE